MPQLLKNTPATIQLEHYVLDDLQDLDANPTVTVVDSAGTAITSGTVAKPGGTTGTYRSSLDVPNYVTWLTATWTGAYSGNTVVITQRYEVVGSLLFALGELRAFKSTLTADDTKLVLAREAVTDQFEQWCGQSFIPREAYETFDGGTSTLQLSNTRCTSVVRIEVGGTSVSLTSGVHLYEHGRLVYEPTFATDYRNVEVWYEHGHTYPPADIKRAAIKYAAYLVSSEVSTVDPRSQGVTNELGLVLRYAPMMPTGLPDVDAVLRSYRRPALGRVR